MLHNNAYKKLCSLSAILLLVLFLSTDFYAAPGDLDPTFGSGGIVVTPIINAPYFAETTSMQVQPDGKIVVGGRIKGEEDPDGNPYTVSFFLARYHPNGTLDASFGTDGKIVAPINSGGEIVSEDIALQPDGKIVAVGNLGFGAAVNRYNSDGTLDASFGTGGRVVTPIGYAHKVAVQADGKIVVVGYGSSGFAVIRYNPNGSLDTSFGGSGKVITLFGGNIAQAFTVILQSDGKIVAGGFSLSSNQTYSFALARYNANGSLDSGFGAGGKVVQTFPNANASLNDAVLQPDGRIVVVGRLFLGNPPVSVIVRYNTNGSIDTSFAQNGIFRTDGNFSVSNGVALQSDGKLVAFGSARADFTSERRFAVARLNPNGTPDTSFGTNGRVITPVNLNSGAAGGAVQSDGKILAFGWTNTPTSDSDVAIVRYLGDLVVARRTPFDFDGDGRADISVFRQSDGTWYLNRSTQGISATQFGLSTDRITPADYDGDGKTDIAVYRDGTWYLQRSNLGFTGTAFGASTDIPVPADFDGDGKAELAVFRPSNGVWYSYNLATNQQTSFAFGQAGDIPAAADYDGDGKADIAVFRQGIWYVQRSSLGFIGIAFGLSTDKPVPADYDGDGKTDVAVFRPDNGVWYLMRSNLGLTGVQFGFGTDKPVPADYDGDGKADVAVFRDGVWHIQKSTGGFTNVNFGVNTDEPVPNAYVP